MRLHHPAGLRLAIFLSAIATLQVGCDRSPGADGIADARLLGAFNATDPARSGYKLVFDDEFEDASGINFSQSDDGAPGFRWYARLFAVWGGTTSRPESFSISKGVLTIAGGQIGTAAPARNLLGFVGTTISNGGYFEARIAFDPATVRFDPHAPITQTNWWPSFYAMPIEYFTQTAQWPGQAAGFAHFVEDDFFEAWRERRRYGGTMHDWYGLPGCRTSGTNSGYCDVANDGGSLSVVGKSFGIKVPDGTDWRQFHVVGQLWVSGGSNANKTGFVQYYFDGRPSTDRVTWRDTSIQGPPPSGKSAFSILDQDHMVVYIGSPVQTPLKVDWVRIWQLSKETHGTH
jgi:hypothetical protein